MITATKNLMDAANAGSAVSKDGYEFNPMDDHWRLNKDANVAMGISTLLPATLQSGFRSTLRRYAEEMSANHTINMAKQFNKFLRDTGALGISSEHLLNWRAMLGGENEWQLGALKGFLLAWHDYGYVGISKDVASLLEGWRIRGNEKGRAVADGCPESGPYTDLEMAALFDWANKAVAEQEIEFESYAYLLALAMTARRPVQVASLRGKDLIRDEKGGNQFRIRIPRAKQRGIGFRGEFRSLAVVDDLFIVLEQQHRRSVAEVEGAIDDDISADMQIEIPIFLNHLVVEEIIVQSEVENLLMGKAPDMLHATTSQLKLLLNKCARASVARSERTGEYIRLSATRFRRTRGTKLRREGFGAHIIAELLDHSDIQNVKVYTENTIQEAVVIDQLVGAQLAPFAQACLGKLVYSEREAIRGDDPRSRVSSHMANGVGTCGNYGFCASGYRACYTCHHFQPWVDGPHQEVLDELYAEKERVRSAGCAVAVVNASDQLILAVEHCVALCREAKSHASPGLSEEE